MPMKLYVGDVIQTKKNHPCQKKDSDRWEIMRVGMDFRIKCLACGNQVWLSRTKLEKSIRRILVSNAPSE